MASDASDPSVVLSELRALAVSMIDFENFRDMIVLGSHFRQDEEVAKWRAALIRELEEAPEEASLPSAEEFGRELTSRYFTQLKTVAQIIDNSILVLAHSILDAGINDLLRVTLDLAPDFWRDRGSDRKVTFQDLRKTRLADVDRQVREAVLEDHLGRSLAERIRVLHSICARRAEQLERTDFSVHVFPDYKYDEKLLKTIDRLRQNIVHGKAVFVDNHDIHKHLSFIACTLLNELWLIAVTFRIYVEEKPYKPRILPTPVNIVIRAKPSKGEES